MTVGPFADYTTSDTGGSGSVVEHLLAKERVGSSNLLFRSGGPWPAGADRCLLSGQAAPAAAPNPTQLRPEWRNRQTRGSQKPVPARACRFDPDLRHPTPASGFAESLGAVAKLSTPGIGPTKPISSRPALPVMARSFVRLLGRIWAPSFPFAPRRFRQPAATNCLKQGSRRHSSRG